MKRELHVPPVELAKAEALPSNKRRAARNKHQRWGGGEHKGENVLRDMEEARLRAKKADWLY